MLTYQVEAAGVLLTLSKPSDLKGWGLRLAKRASAPKARRGPSVILLRPVGRQQSAPATGERHHQMSYVAKFPRSAERAFLPGR